MKKTASKPRRFFFVPIFVVFKFDFFLSDFTDLCADHIDSAKICEKDLRKSARNFSVYVNCNEKFMSILKNNFQPKSYSNL